GSPITLWPSAFASTNLAAAAEVVTNSCIWLGGMARFERVDRGNDADQNQHDQSHPLLSVIGAVRKAHAGASEDEEPANPPRWRRVALGRVVKLWPPDQKFHQEKQGSGQDEAHDRREQ